MWINSSVCCGSCSMNMKSVIAVFVVLAINQIQAQFPKVADKDGIQIDFTRRVDSTDAYQDLLEYAKFLAKRNSNPQQIRPTAMEDYISSYLSLMRPPIKPTTGETVDELHPPIRPPTSEIEEETRPHFRLPTEMADQTTSHSYLSLMRPPIRPSDNEIAEDQTTALCPTSNCSCNVSLLIAYGFIRDRNGRPTDNCTVYNVPYCDGVCSSSYRYHTVYNN